MPVGPGFTDGIDVAVGDAILASHVDNLADNTETNRLMADADHDFDVSTGTGRHKAEVGSGKEPLHLSALTNAAAATCFVIGFWQDSAGGWWLLGKNGTAAFTRAQAEFALPMISLADAGVPAS
jgi:hypothetical protein